MTAHQIKEWGYVGISTVEPPAGENVTLASIIVRGVTGTP